MGAFIPIGGGADSEIKGALNAAFDDSNLKILQYLHNLKKGERFFDRHHKLYRMAFRLGAYPTKTYPNDDAKGKWFYFLKQTLEKASYNGKKTGESIRAILTYAMDPKNNVRCVTFDSEDKSPGTFDHYIKPDNPTLKADIDKLMDITGNLQVVLVCPKQLDNVSEPEPKPGDHDQDDHGQDVEKPPEVIFEPKYLRPPKLSRSTRRPAYVSAAKKKKKVKRTKKAKKSKKVTKTKKR